MTDFIASPAHALTYRKPRRHFSLFAFFGLRQQRLDLSRLSAEQLNDIGVTAQQANAEAQRNMWDVPQHWRD